MDRPGRHRRSRKRAQSRKESNQEGQQNRHCPVLPMSVESNCPSTSLHICSAFLTGSCHYVGRMTVLVRKLVFFVSQSKEPLIDLGEVQGMLKLASLTQRVSHPVWQYGLAVVSVAVALSITGLLEPTTTLRTPLFYIAIIISGWFGGMGPGLLSVVLSTLAIGYYFAPGHQTPISNPDSRPFFVLFLLSALIACWISVQRRRGGESLKGAGDELEARVDERTADLRRASEGLRAEIAERKRGEEVLRERADLLDLTHDTVFVRDTDNVITFWNRAAQALYGWTRQEAVGQVSHQLMQTIFLTPLAKIMAELNSTGRWEGELIHTRRDGTQVVVASRWALQLNEQEKPIAVLETNNDITERKRAEE